MFCLHAQVPKVNGVEFKFDDLLDKLDANYNRKSNDSSKLSASFIVSEPNLYCHRILITRSVTQQCDMPPPPHFCLAILMAKQPIHWPCIYQV